MAKEPKEWLVSWLNDAYAMEESITEVLKDHVKDAEGHPQLHARLQQHIEETKRHAELDRQCIDHLGGDVSNARGGMANIMGRFQGKMTSMADDELVKDGISDYATEHFEIASYKAISKAAEALGEDRVVQSCQQILQDEMSMAKFLAEHLPEVVRDTIRGKAGAVA